MDEERGNPGNTVEVERVGFRYRTGQGVADVTFQAAPGELLGIVGPNSAGKSTLLRMLSKVVVPQRGRILIGGRDVARQSRLELARSLAVVPQEFSVAFPFSVAEVVLMGRFPHTTGGSWASDRDRDVAEAAMQATGILALAARRVDELSGGERQLVSIARALAQEPSVLLLDEPTTHLDLRHQRTILEILLAHHREGRLTTILVSHDLNLAAECCDRILLLVEGRVQALGAPEEVITEEHLASAYGCPVEVERRSTTGRPRVHGSLPRQQTNGSHLSTPRM
jgi:cobalamin transport system ATP-binding protein